MEAFEIILSARAGTAGRGKQGLEPNNIEKQSR